MKILWSALLHRATITIHSSINAIKSLQLKFEWLHVRWEYALQTRILSIAESLHNRQDDHMSKMFNLGNATAYSFPPNFALIVVYYCRCGAKNRRKAASFGIWPTNHGQILYDRVDTRCIPSCQFFTAHAMLALQALYISYSNSVCQSVRPSVRPSHTGIVSKRRHVARCSLHRCIAECV